MIQSFRCSDTAALHQRRRVARWVNIEAVARRKLDQLHAAGELRDMAAPPGNRLEALSGNREGQHSIRINEIVRERRGISADTALRLARFFNTSNQFWLNLQSNYDVQCAEDAGGRVIARIKPWQGAVDHEVLA